jgi:hypothetical protein
LSAVGAAAGRRARLALVAALAWVALVAVAQRAPAATLPTAWCGNDRTATSRTPDLEVSSREQIHVLYAFPADGGDRFGSLASAIASDVAAIDAWWRGQDPTRTPRFDLFGFPGCASRFGDLDLGFARLPRPGSAYLGATRPNLLIGDLADVAQPLAKSLVYYDGPVPSDDQRFICGFSSRSARSGGSFGFSFVFLQSACPNDLGRGQLTARVAAHELLHNLGAVPDAGPPHECAGANSGHVCDDRADILYPFLSPGATLDAAVLDVGRDDYYGHAGTWWDVQDSDWLVRLPQFPLTVATAGTSGIVASDPAGISCPPACSQLWDNGLEVTLVARPSPGSRLLDWGGACPEARAACVVRMDAAKRVTARFGPGGFALTVRVTSGGRVTSSPAGISCPTRCAAEFGLNAVVQLRPVARAGFRFAGWGGACRGGGACSVRIERSKSVLATFRRR